MEVDVVLNRVRHMETEARCSEAPKDIAISIVWPRGRFSGGHGA